MLATLAADRKRLAEIQHQIFDLERTLAALKLENSTVQRRLDAYQYPVLTLPNEIISEIFLNVLPPYPECAPYLGLHSPLNLTHICRKWRQIAFATPRLWRALLLGPTDVWNDLQGVWVDRSGCCPLSIAVDDGFKEEQMVYRGGEFLEAILPYRDRCEYLQLITTDFPLPLIPGSWPSLRHLDLDLSNDLDLRLDLSDVPLLRSARLECASAHSLDLPWTQLTLLRMHTIRLDQALDVLQKATKLRRCELDLEIDFGVDDEMLEAGPRVVTLPHLESLRLSGDGEPMTDTLSYFNLPALSILDVNEELLHPYPIGSLRSFISRSSCSLKHVGIEGWRSVADGAYPAAFPSIEYTFATRLPMGLGSSGVEDVDS
ncbi:F-box domain-containing protein [Favolaschia claudopus]|uniref:F-box domain-containing protein n=1 Tax=Favolaschia claudopus TaxID=2862362 RepID=A0AAW0BG35_9AGAR